MDFITVNDITLNTKLDGLSTGQTIVFINSLGTDYRTWDAVVPHFVDTYQILRYDKRGHGLSDCPTPPYRIRNFTDDLFALLNILDIDNIVLIGLSVGGMIAMDFASQHPDLVQALVLSDTFPKISTADMWNERINALRQHGMERLGDTILSRWFAPSYKQVNPSGYQGYYNMLTRMPVAGYTGTCEAIRDADLTDIARTIQIPSLVLCGAEDSATTPELVQGLSDILLDSRYVEIANAGHLPCIENPNAMSAAIRSFLEDVL